MVVRKEVRKQNLEDLSIPELLELYHKNNDKIEQKQEKIKEIKQKLNLHY